MTTYLGDKTRFSALSRHLIRGRGGSGGSGAGLLSDDELIALEETYADGITAVQAVDIFVSRGVRFVIAVPPG